MSLRKIVAFFFRTPSRAVLLSFIIAILFGSVLLQLPRATVSPGKLSFCDALFTSTSATCVTGLTVADTGCQFTIFGQIIILIMIQIGGLGIITISTFFIFLISGKLDIFEREVIFDTISQNPVRNLRRLLKTGQRIGAPNDREIFPSNERDILVLIGRNEDLEKLKKLHSKH